jgi:hypothetical protein
LARRSGKCPRIDLRPIPRVDAYRILKRQILDEVLVGKD